MKTFLLSIVILAAVAAGGYFGLPVFMERQVEPLRKDVLELKARLEKAEQFVRQEQELRKGGVLPPDAGMSKVIGVLNTVTARVEELDKAIARQTSIAEAFLKKERDEREQAARKQTEDLQKVKKATEEASRQADFRAEIGQIRDHLLKTKIDLASRNIGTAKNDLGNVQRTLEKLTSKVPEAAGPAVEEARENVRKAIAAMDADVVAASDRINIAWRELEKLVPIK